jgi:hypothetical protein
MEPVTVLKNKYQELMILQYEMVLCIRHAFEFDDTEEQLPITVQLNSFGRGNVIVRPDVVNRTFVIQNTVTGDKESINYTTDKETLPILRDRIITHLTVSYLKEIQW